MSTNATEQPIGRVLEELARDRGYSGLEELAEAVNAATGGDYTADELANWPRAGFGHGVDAVVRLTEAEKQRLVRAVVERIGC